MKKLNFLPVVTLALTTLPLLLFIWVSSNLFKKSIKTSVVNNPQAGLVESFNSLTGNYDRAFNHNLLNALRLASNESLKNYLSSPVTSTAPFKSICESHLVENPSDLFVLMDQKGDILYDNLGIPQPIPGPEPTYAVKRSKHLAKSLVPLLGSAKDWPGMDLVLTGTKMSGMFFFQNSTFLTLLVPIEHNGKIEGVVAIGSKINGTFLKTLKNNAVNDLAFYSQSQTWCTSSIQAPQINYPPLLQTTALPMAQPVTWGSNSFLYQGLTLLGLDQKPAALLAVFQPVKQTQIIEESPLHLIFLIGILFLIATLALTGILLKYHHYSFKRLLQSIEEISHGNLNVSVPYDNGTQWGQLGWALLEMQKSLKEKERISLILGKVVDPQAARKILAEKDYFSIKGEKRECTILRAELKGFNTLSENMAPETLVDALNQYFSLINDRVFKFEGMLDRFVGETAIAVWGAPFNPEDREIRAVKTALDIQEALRNFNISRINIGFPPFTVSIGIHSGPVVSGNLGSNKHFDYSIIGEALHLVARLCSLAAPGQVLLSEETYEKVKTRVKVNPLNSIAVKGSMEPLKIYEVTQWIP